MVKNKWDNSEFKHLVRIRKVNLDFLKKKKGKTSIAKYLDGILNKKRNEK